MTRSNPLLASGLFDVDTLAALQRANLDAMLKANRQRLDAAQAIVDLRLRWLAASFEAAAVLAPAMNGHKPEPLAGGLRQAGEHALSMMRGELEVSLKAQSEVAQTLVELASANLKEIEGLARR